MCKTHLLRGLSIVVCALTVVVLSAPAEAQVTNVKVVTDASPDYSDMKSMIHSITSKWKTPKEKCWVVWYWNHIGRRQTQPMIVHGMELTDPIRQYNDYGYTMCSTVAGVNCGIWANMGLPVKFWDISMHTVAECFYDDRWHMYDSSMSAIYTLCDGKTLAGVEDIGATGACDASGGRNEPGHIAKYHCLAATSNNGWLTGADFEGRSLQSEFGCFNPKGLKFRYYLNNWDWGHRYILNLREGEVYTRYYASKGDEPKWWVPNTQKKTDPDAANKRYHIRGNGIWTFRPTLTPAAYKRFVFGETNIAAADPAGLRPARAAAPAEVVFKVNSANVTSGMSIRADLLRRTDADAAAIALSTTGGLTWKEVWKADKTGDVQASLDLVDEVSGSYETLVKVTLTAAERPDDALLKTIHIETTTMLNSKTQPKLLLGKNTVYVDTGDQTDSIVVWPDLQGEAYKPHVVEEKNIQTREEHQGWNGVMFAARAGEEAYVVFKVDAPREIVRLNYGGRFYNRAQNATTKLMHSFDDGKTWQNPWTLTDTKAPWDVIHYETVENVPAGVQSVLFKYSLNATAAGNMACSFYAIRMEVHHKPVDPGFKPIEVTFTWDEVQSDRKRVERSHTQLVSQVPFKYVINTAGADLPVVKSLRTNLAGAVADVRYGYSDGNDPGGERWVYRWVTYGRNFLEGKPYTVSAAATGQWGANDPEGKKLTDGVVGPGYAGGTCPASGLSWSQQSGEPLITVDIGKPETLGVFRIHITAGWPWWDALKGEVKDEVEVLTSLDGNDYTSQGKFDLNLWYKDVPVNHMLPDEETAKGWNFTLVPEKPVNARYVRYKVTPKRTLVVSEVQALDSITYRPFDMSIALPDEK